MKKTMIKKERVSRRKDCILFFIVLAASYYLRVSYIIGILLTYEKGIPLQLARQTKSDTNHRQPTLNLLNHVIFIMAKKNLDIHGTVLFTSEAIHQVRRACKNML
jgi:hypothetical protein